MSIFEYLFWILLTLVFYTYLGYGILLLVLVKIKRLFIKAKTENPDFEPEVCLIIPCYNEEDFIREKANNSLELDYPKNKLRIAFITDGSTDRTTHILSQIKGIEVWHQDGRAGKAAAQNRAMKLNTAPFVVFSDANTLLNKEAIRKLVRHYANKEVGGVSGEKRVIPTFNAELSGAGEGLYWKYESTLKKLDSELKTIVGAAGELVSFRSELWTDLETDSILDDFMQSMRIAAKGYRFIYEPEAYAMETPSANFKEELKRKVRIAAGGWQSMSRLKAILLPWPDPVLSFMYVSHRVLRWSLAALALPILFVLNAIILRESIVYSVLFSAQLLFYALAAWGYKDALNNRKNGINYVPFYFSMMNYAVFAGFLRWRRGKQSAAWERSKRA